MVMMKLGEFIELTLWYKHISKSVLAKEMGMVGDKVLIIKED